MKSYRTHRFRAERRVMHWIWLSPSYFLAFPFLCEYMLPYKVEQNSNFILERAALLFKYKSTLGFYSKLYFRSGLLSNKRPPGLLFEYGIVLKKISKWTCKIELMKKLLLNFPFHLLNFESKYLFYFER